MRGPNPARRAPWKRGTQPACAVHCFQGFPACRNVQERTEKGSNLGYPFPKIYKGNGVIQGCFLQTTLNNPVLIRENFACGCHKLPTAPNEKVNGKCCFSRTSLPANAAPQQGVCDEEVCLQPARSFEEEGQTAGLRSGEMPCS